MPLADAGKFIWRGGASSYIFAKDYDKIFELAVDPKEDVGKASSGELKSYRSSIQKRSLELTFSNIGATQYRQFATIWKQSTILKLRRSQTDANLGTFWWTEGFDFGYSDEGMRYKDLWGGRIKLEEV